jgi:YVTN family beta-propeller protein
MPVYNLSRRSLAAASSALAMLLVLPGIASVAQAQSALETIAMGSTPKAIAINPVTHKIYVVVSNGGNHYVRVFDAITGATTDVTTTASSLGAIAVNPVTNKVYVTSYISVKSTNTPDLLTIIDGATNVASTVQLGTSLETAAVAVNPVTNMIYVLNHGDSSVSVIDGASANIVQKITTGTGPNSGAWAIAVNPVTNKTYVANYGDSSVSVIDGTNLSGTPVRISIGSGGSQPNAIAINAVTNTIFVANKGDGKIAVINGTTNTVTTTPTVGANPEAIAVNPVTNQIYVANFGGNSVSVIDGANPSSVAATVTVGSTPEGIAVNPGTNQIYVANTGGSSVTVIDGASNNTSSVQTGAAPLAVAVSPVTNKIYVANSGASSVTEIDGAVNKTSTVTVAGNQPGPMAMNPATGVIFAVDQLAGTVTAIDTVTNTVSPAITVGANPVAIAVNPVLNTAYVANQGGDTISVIDGSTLTVTEVTVGPDPVSIAVNQVNQKIYVVNETANTVSVIDGSSNNVLTTISVGANPLAIALNPFTNKVYVANQDDNTVDVIDGSTNSVSSVIAVGTWPWGIAINPLNNQIYVANAQSDNVTVIDGATNNTSTVSVGSLPEAIAVNPVTGKVYVANRTDGTVSVIDGSSKAVLATPAVGPSPAWLAINSITNQVYVATVGSRTISIVDGTTNSVVASPITSNQPDSLVVNSATGRVYVSELNSNTVTVFDTANFQQIPITATSAIASDSYTVSSTAPFTTRSTAPTFTATVTSAYDSSSPYSTLTITDPPPSALYYWIDDGSAVSSDPNAWAVAADNSSADANPATFNLALSNQDPGLHTLYYFAAYGDEGTAASSSNGTGNTPEIGNLQTLVYAILPATSTTALTSDVNPQDPGSTVTFTATVTPGSGRSASPTGIVTFFADGTQLGTSPLSGNTATYQTSTLTVGSHSISATYSGDIDYASSTGSMTEQIAGVPASIEVLSGTGQSASPGSNFPNPLVVQVNDINGTPVPGVTVTFSGANLSFGAPMVSTGANGQASTTAMPLIVGSVTVTASVSGGTITATLSENSKPAPGLALSSSGSTTTYGGPVTFTATFSGFSGSNPVGLVNFISNGVSLGSGTISGTTATLTTPALQGGSDRVFATFLGDANYTYTASNVITQTVNKATPSIALASSGPNSTYGGSVTLTATMTGVSGTGVLGPSGPVAFTSNGDSVGSATITGTAATLITGALQAGSDTVKAIYSGDANYVAINPVSISQTVAKATPTLVLTSVGTPVYGGASVTFTATLTGATGTGVSAPTGAVNFTSSEEPAASITFASPTIVGTTATVTTGSLLAGNETITAIYSGDVNYNAVNPVSIAQYVAKATPTMTLTGSASSSSYGTQLSFTATLTGVSATNLPTNTVTFFVDNAAYGNPVPVINGIATLLTSALPGGSHTVAAQYMGDANYNGIGGSQVSRPSVGVTTSKATPTMTLTTSGSPSPYGAPVTFAATLSGPTGSGVSVPTNTVTMVVDHNTGSPITATVINGVATLTTNALSVGAPHTVTAAYNGDANYNALPAISTTQMVAKSSITLAGPSTAPSFVYGVGGTVPVTVTGQYTGAGIATPTGKLTYNIDSGAAQTAAIAASGAVLTVPASLSAGAHTITMNYAGDGNFAAATATQLSLTITKATATMTLTSSGSPSAYGAAVTFTAALTGVTGSGVIAPTNTVLFTVDSTQSTVAINNGTATLTTNTLSAGGPHTITAAYNGDTNYNTLPAVSTTQTVNQSTTTLAGPSTAPSFVYGTGGAVPVTVSGQYMGTGVATPTGTLAYSIDNGAAQTAPISAGVAALTVPASLSAGAHTITVTYAGDSNFAGATTTLNSVAVTKATPTMTLAGSASTSSYGTPVSFTATLTGVSSTNLPTNTVTFFVDKVQFGNAVPVISGAATLVTSALVGGPHTIAAQYMGDANYNGLGINQVTPPNVAVTISKATPAMTFTSSGSPSPYGAPVTFTATLMGPTGSGVSIPTNTVTLVVDSNTGNPITATIGNGVATLTTNALSVGGPHTVTAAYNGDANYAALPAMSTTQMVSKASITLAGPSTAPSFAYGVGGAVPVTVTGQYTGAGIATPSGNLTYSIDSGAAQTAAISSGGAVLTIPASLSGGTHTIVMSYAGDSNFAAATAPQFSVTITKATATMTLTSSGSPSAYGAAVTFTAALTGVAGSSASVPANTVLFTVDNTPSTVAVNNGVATLTTNTLSVGGPHTITAAYNGDTNYNSLPAVSTAQTVNQSTTTLAGPSAAPSFSYGTGGTVPVTVSGQYTGAGAITPTGTLTYSIDNGAAQTAAISAGVAALTVPAVLPVGAHTIAVTYAGDGNFAGASTTLNSIAVVKATPTMTLTGSGSPSVYGAPVTFTVTLTGASASGVSVPTNTVLFTVDKTQSTVTINNGIATLTTNTLSAGGSHTVTAAYNGDTNYTALPAMSTTQAVNQATTTMTGPSTAPSFVYGVGGTVPVTVTGQYTGAGISTPTGMLTYNIDSGAAQTAAISSGGAVLAVPVSLSAGAHTITANYSGDSNFAAATAPITISITVTTAPLTVTANPQSKLYGATDPALTYSITSGSLVGTDALTGALTRAPGESLGSYPIQQGTLSAGSNYTLSFIGANLTITVGNLTVSADSTSRVYGVANPTFTGKVTGAASTDSFTETFSTSAAITSNVGGYSIVPSVSGSNLSDYTTVIVNGTLTITQAGSTTSLAVSSGSITPGQSVTLSATVTSTTSGTPTGTVSFYDGTTLLNTATLAAGSASYSTAALAPGISHTLTASYSGDGNFTASASNSSGLTVVVAPLDFTVTTVGANTATINAGGSATFQFGVTPLYGIYAGPITFTAGGLPPGATATFTPASIAANGGPQTVSFTVQTATFAGLNQTSKPLFGGLATAALALLLLPFAGARRVRRASRRLNQLICLLLLAGGLVGSMLVSGCGASSSKTSVSQGNTEPQSYTLTVTTSGGGLEHTSTFTLTVN